MRTGRKKIFSWLLQLYFLFVVSSTIVHASECTNESIYYAFQCLAIPGCGWCCDQPAGQQCFDLENSFSSGPLACADDAYINSSDMTCAQLCETSNYDCDSCELKKWCYFCLSSSSCQPSYASCKESLIIQSCNVRNGSNDGISYFTVFIYVGIGLFCIALILGMVILFLRLRGRLRLGLPRLQEPFLPRPLRGDQLDAAGEVAGPPPPAPAPAPEGQEEAGPGPGPGPEGQQEAEPGEEAQQEEEPEGEEQQEEEPESESGIRIRIVSEKASAAEDERLCSICLYATPTVTFLPCYHTCCCEGCSSKIRPVDDILKCPLCRVKIKSMINLYNVMRKANK